MASTASKRFRIEGGCHYCSREATTRDHIVPQVLGGGDGKYNLVGCCAPCNLRKDSKWPDCKCDKCELARWLFFAKRNTPMRDQFRAWRDARIRLQRIRQRVRLIGPDPIFTSNAQRLARRIDWLERDMRKRERILLRDLNKPLTYSVG